MRWLFSFHFPCTRVKSDRLIIGGLKSWGIVISCLGDYKYFFKQHFYKQQQTKRKRNIVQKRLTEYTALLLPNP